MQYFADISKKYKIVIAIYVYASESSCFALSENGVGYYAMIYSLEDNSVQRWWILLNFCWVSTFLDLLFFTISRTVNISDSYKKNTTFWKSIIRFLAEQEGILCNLRTITQERNKEVRQMSPFFASIFWLSSNDQWYSFLYLKINKIHFHEVLLSSILVSKIPAFWRCKLWNQNFVSFDSGNIHIKACVHYFLLFLKEKCISSLFQTKYTEKKFNLQLIFLPIVSWIFTLLELPSAACLLKTSCFVK